VTALRPTVDKRVAPELMTAEQRAAVRRYRAEIAQILAPF
jgi:hypothetical protein